MTFEGPIKLFIYFFSLLSLVRTRRAYSLYRQAKVPARESGSETLSRQTEKRDEYEQWLNTAFSPWYSYMDIICFHIFSVLLCISLPSVVISRITEASEGCRRTECKKTNKRDTEGKWGLFAFEHSSKRITSVFSDNTMEESALHLLVQLWVFLSVCISVFQHRWTNIKHPKEISHPHFTPESLLMESHDYFTRKSLSAHLNSVWSVSDVGGKFWVFHWGL